MFARQSFSLQMGGDDTPGRGKTRRRGAGRTGSTVLLLASSILAACGGGGGSGDAYSGATPARETLPDAQLIQKANLVYEGAFRVPPGSSDAATFAWGGTGLGFNPANQSLFMTGNDVHQQTAELAIPEIRTSKTIDGLAIGSLLQAFRDPTEGRLSGVNPAGGDTKVGGHLVYNGRLIVTGYTYYDASNSQNRSHFVRPVSLASTGQVQGPLAVPGPEARWISGYMGLVPAEWTTAFGGTALTGLAGVNIAGAASNGPAAAVFDPDTMDYAKLVVGYGLDQALPSQYGLSFDQANPYWNFTSTVRGVVFPSGTRSVLFFGRHGLAAQQYGVDPLTGYKGYYAQPYAYQVWAYDAQDLLRVKIGSQSPHSVKPYAVWNFNLPFEEGNPQRDVGGAAYDPATQRIFVSQIRTDGDLPVIHVLRVNVGSR